MLDEWFDKPICCAGICYNEDITVIGDFQIRCSNCKKIVYFTKHGVKMQNKKIQIESPEYQRWEKRVELAELRIKLAIWRYELWKETGYIVPRQNDPFSIIENIEY